MWLVEVDMCYADNSPNTTLQSKTGKNHHCSITYMHLIWLATEMDTVVPKLVAQDPSSICYHPKEDTPVKSHAKPIPSRWSTGAPALVKIAFSSLLWSFFNSKYFHMDNNILDRNNDYFVYTNIFITSDAELKSLPMPKAILGLFLARLLQ